VIPGIEKAISIRPACTHATGMWIYLSAAIHACHNKMASEAVNTPDMDTENVGVFIALIWRLIKIRPGKYVSTCALRVIVCSMNDGTQAFAEACVIMALKLID
jgi:hypothetical protein